MQMSTVVLRLKVFLLVDLLFLDSQRTFYRFLALLHFLMRMELLRKSMVLFRRLLLLPVRVNSAV
jgi:hypothetical protein